MYVLFHQVTQMFAVYVSFTYVFEDDNFVDSGDHHSDKTVKGCLFAGTKVLTGVLSKSQKLFCTLADGPRSLPSFFLHSGFFAFNYVLAIFHCCRQGDQMSL
jgi:hypothetical protein